MPAFRHASNGRKHLAVQTSRRTLLVAALAGTVAMPAWSSDDYPSRPIKFVIGAPPGGAGDTTVRVLGRHLESTLGQAVVVENRPGAATLIGLGAVARSPADGYTIGLSTVAGLAIVGVSNPSAPDLRKDLTTLAGVVNAPHVLAVPASLPARSIPELVELFRAAPGRYNFASQGEGSLSHLESALFASLNGLTLQHIPYTGSTQAMPDLLSGATNMMFDSAASVAPHVQAGKLRVLGTAAAERLGAFPQAPTMVESGMASFRADNPFGIYGPAGLPPKVAARLTAALQAALASPQVQQALRTAGMEPRFTPPQAFVQTVAAEYALWQAVLRSTQKTP
jgi:tripartite-type tricarboxylate transporter receptor subunit TctC